MTLSNEANLARLIDMYIARKGGGVSKSIIKYNVLSIFEIILFMKKTFFNLMFSTLWVFSLTKVG